MLHKCKCRWYGHLYNTDGPRHTPLCPKCQNEVEGYGNLVTRNYLRDHPDEIFIFGDNLLRKGKGGAALLRDEPNTYGFVTKKAPNNNPESFFTPREYREIYEQELEKLQIFCDKNNDKVLLLSKIGFGLANRYKIWEYVIEPQINALIRAYPTIWPLWE